MNLVDFTEFLVKSVVINKENVSVKEFETEDDNTILIQVLVDESDKGRVIGKEGKTINSIKTLVQASSYLKDNKKVKIDIDSF